MQITITNGTVPTITEVLVPNKGYMRPASVTVTGATSSYTRSSGTLVLSNPQASVSVTAVAIKATIELYLDDLDFAAGTYEITAKSVGAGYLDSDASNAVSYTAVSFPKATVTGLGNSDPSTVTFARDSGFPTSFDTWTDNYGNVFIKIPTMYRRVLATSKGQITSFAISTGKMDGYEVYPVFKYDRIILPYVYIGVYCYNSTSTASSTGSGSATVYFGNARTMARNVGTGYQQYDVHFQKLFQDLALVISQNVNFNDGTGVESYLGIHNLDGRIWVDGIARPASLAWLVCYDPSKYVNEPTASTDGYYQLSYVASYSSAVTNVRMLGYDINHEFINYPTAAITNTLYDSYYCDKYSGDNYSVSVVSTNVGGTDSIYGLWHTTYGSRNESLRARLCYRPISS